MSSLAPAAGVHRVLLPVVRVVGAGLLAPAAGVHRVLLPVVRVVGAGLLAPAAGVHRVLLPVAVVLFGCRFLVVACNTFHYGDLI
jgi:hypothetical protein